MAVSILMVVLFGLLLVNYRIDRSVLYPPFVLCFMWLLVFGIYQAHVIEIDPLHTPTLLLVGAGMALFTLGGGLAMLLPRVMFTTRIKLGPLAARPRQGSWIPYLLLALSCAGMLLVVHNTFVVAASGKGGNVLARARDAAVAASIAGESSGGSSNPLIVYTPIWSTLFSVLFLLEGRKKLFWLMASISFIASLFTTGRGPIITLFCSLMAAYLMRENKLRLLTAARMLRIPIGVMFLLYVVLIFTNKNVSVLGGSVFSVIVFVVGSYFVSPVVAFDYVLRHPEQYAHEPNHTFKFFLGALAKIHVINYEPPPQLDQFVTVPFPANVYTGFKFYYTDFGVAGCLTAVFVIGFLHSLLYRKARNGSVVCMYLFAATFFPAVMFIFDDLYSAFGEDLNILFVGLLYFATRSMLVRSPNSLRFQLPRLPQARLLPGRSFSFTRASVSDSRSK